MNKTKVLRAFMLSIILATAMTLSAQSNGLFGYGKNRDSETAGNRDGENEGVTIGSMSNENPTPVGNGLLIMFAAGAGYVLLKKKEESK